ncbi:Alpha-1,3/1,6-mannosyltransferase ALG2 [Seminavis robusta]|uniref:Alpha-1,3/1,6-mannosyltransferase ALG2 n=1 Tax=Seminavis robusta TaxID=568900 RepID=A0A9N8H8W7_9STRA|nr:Alpha-1,3/1,6-mannosyltransferase ALG2 [Seminavis robusta]|eukprot:Sro184_g079890.1 Alpha-1,3/1,6-mannosyltransferase ALG2 (521) ;mRNA; f:33541-35103
MSSSDAISPTAAESSNSSQKNNTNNKESSADPPLNVLFLHLDLGIGGAEQLVLQLAMASQALGHSVTLLTTRCDADHCFAAVKPPHGALYRNVQVWGRWIPANLLGVGTALCSHVRVLYLAMAWAWQIRQHTPDQSQPYLIVLDVLPTPLWILRHFTNSSLLFYCHFPDKLLIRNNPLDPTNTTTATVKKSFYRTIMDAMEESCMPLADSLLVNSKFTQRTVLQEFASLKPSDLQVLYPALDTQAMDAKPTDNNDNDDDNDPPPVVTIVSLNRYERKKKIELILYAYALLRVQYPPNTLQVIIAGGYDTQNAENVEYRGELERIAFTELKLDKQEVDFQTSISDAQRAHLLKTARCVVYTPPNEHFGIVPLEVMYAGTPVIACASGGPLESIVDGETGFLCDPPTPQTFANAINVLLVAPAKAQEMGQAGRKHARIHFGTERLQREWASLTQQAFKRGQQRVCQKEPLPIMVRLVIYFLECILAMVVCLWLTRMLRHTGWIDSQESILGSMRRKMQSDEL